MFGLQVVGKGKCDSSLESSRREQQEENFRSMAGQLDTHISRPEFLVAIP